MSGYKYFFFQKDKEFDDYVFYIYNDSIRAPKNSILNEDIINKSSIESIAIRIKTNTFVDSKYKIDSEIPYFGGIILEDVQYRFQELQKVKNPLILLELFRQYVVGLKEITDKGYVHSDIKADNLMYNITNGNYEAKIIDIDVVDMKKKTGIFQRREELLQDLNRKTEHNTAQELLNRERNDEDNKHLDKITRSYDLYSLCETFLGITHLTITQKDGTIYTITSTPYNLLDTISKIPGFLKLLDEGTNINFEERIDIDQALSKVCAIQKYAEAARRQRLLNTRLSTPKRRWGGRRTQKKKK